MESPDLKSEFPDDARLEAWLRANAALPPLPDEGFSARVLAALPTAAPRRAARRRYCLAGALVGTAVVFAAAWRTGGLVSLPELSAPAPAGLEPVAGPAVALALGLAAGSVWFAVRNRVRLLPRL